MAEKQEHQPTLEEIVEQWWRDHAHGSPLARDSFVYEHAFKAKEDLKERLKRVVK